MPVLTYLHELFNADTCHTYIYMLQWNERPLQCPCCQSYDIRPWGHYHDETRWDRMARPKGLAKKIVLQP